MFGVGGWFGNSTLHDWYMKLQCEAMFRDLMEVEMQSLEARTAREQEQVRLKVTLIRGDGRYERHCEHGVGHTVGHLRGHVNSRWEWVHGCDGCCEDYEKQEGGDEEA